MVTKKMGALAVVKRRVPQLAPTCAPAGDKDAQLDAEAGKLLRAGCSLPLHTTVAGGKVGHYHGCCLSGGC